MRVGVVLKHGGAAVVLVAAMVLGVVCPVYALPGKVSMSPSPITLTEGESREVSITLDEPIIAEDLGSGYVLVGVSTGSSGRLSSSPVTTYYSYNEWNQQKTFDLSAVDNDKVDGDQSISVTYQVESNSEYYNHYSGTITVTVLDNDVAPQITSPVTGQSTPAGSLMVTGTGTAGQDIGVTIDGVSVGASTVDQSGNWHLLVQNMSAGNHTITAQSQTSHHYAYMANPHTDSIDVINVDTQSYVREIPDVYSVGTVYDTKHNIVYSAANADGGCHIKGYDPLTYEEIASITPGVACYAVSMALSPDGNTGWLLFQSGDGGEDYAVMEANLVSKTSVNQLPLSVLQATNPSGISIKPGGGEFWIRNQAGIEIFNTADHSHVQTLHINAPGPAYRQNIVFNAAGTLAYTANISSGEVSVINATNKSLIAQVITGEGANVVALSPDESRLFVSASYPSSAIYVVNTSNLVVEESHETEPGLPPESIAITDDGQWVVGDDHGSGAIFFGTVAGGAAIANTIFAPNGGSYYTSTSNFVSPKLVNVLGISTTATFSTANYSVPNTGFDH